MLNRWRRLGRIQLCLINNFQLLKEQSGCSNHLGDPRTLESKWVHQMLIILTVIDLWDFIPKSNFQNQDQGRVLVKGHNKKVKSLPLCLWETGALSLILETLVGLQLTQVQWKVNTGFQIRACQNNLWILEKLWIEYTRSTTKKVKRRSVPALSAHPLVW